LHGSKLLKADTSLTVLVGLVGVGVGVAVGVGVGVGVAVGVGVGVGVAVGVGVGVGAFTRIPLLHTSFLPTSLQVKLIPALTTTAFFFGHLFPAFGAAASAGVRSVKIIVAESATSFHDFMK
jgi:hypothetical protein